MRPTSFPEWFALFILQKDEILDKEVSMKLVKLDG